MNSVRDLEFTQKFFECIYLDDLIGDIAIDETSKFYVNSKGKLKCGGSLSAKTFEATVRD